MADARSSIFNKEATERLRSPDDLDRYVRVTSPSVWVALLAIFLLVVGLLSWGFFGSVSTSVSTQAAYSEGELVCLLTSEDVTKVHEGDRAIVGGKHAEVLSISATPLSRDEVAEVLGSDYLVDALMQGDWAYAVVFKTAEQYEPGVPYAVSITTERVAPISLVIG